MKSNSSLGTLGAVLLVTVTLVVASGAWAQTKYKTLYKFNFESNGYAPFVSVIFESGRKSLLNPKNGREPGAPGLSAPSLLGRLEPTRLSNQAAGSSQFRQHQSAGVPKTLKAGSRHYFLSLATTHY
jgi:hypothetical protein